MLGARRRAQPALGPAALKDQTGEYSTGGNGEYSSGGDSQFKSEAFTGKLTERGIAISMDGRGAWRDNIFVERLWRSVKYEEVVCYERNRCNLDGSGALPKMRVGPSESACRSRLQTATSCVG